MCGKNENKQLQVISAEELINYKILPFDIYNEKGKKLFSEGDELTPGKILQLKYIPVIYKKEKLEIFDEESLEEDIFPEGRIFEKEEVKPDISTPARSVEIKTKIENVNSVIPVQTQKTLKGQFKEMFNSFKQEGIKEPSLCFEVRDKIIEEILPKIDNIFYKSQLQMFGDYNQSHSINVTMLSTVLAEKLKLSQDSIQDITLAAMLHDIGKTKIPSQVLNKLTHSPSEIKLIQLHPRLGYEIILKELNLPEIIAKVALQHHERGNGSGYPYGISGDKIAYESHIIMICNVYDELTSGRTLIKGRSSKEAIKILLEIGSKWFRTDVLYTFVHMTNYNDESVIYSY